MPMFKKGDRIKTRNYQPLSLISIHKKFLDRSIQIARTDHQWAGKKHPAEADHPRLLHFGSETW